MAPNTNTEEEPSRFTETLKEAAGEQWERVVNHKFTKELADGTIDRNVLKRYLVQGATTTTIMMMMMMMLKHVCLHSIR